MIRAVFDLLQRVAQPVYTGCHKYVPFARFANKGIGTLF
jgi:hypothetical protein